MLCKLGNGTNGARRRSRSRWRFRFCGPDLDPRFASHSAGGYCHAPSQPSYAPRGHRDSARRNGNSACRHRNAAGRNGNPTNRTAESEHAGLCFARHNPKSKYARIYFSRNADSGEHHATFDDQSEHTECSRQLAQRLPVRNSARHSKRFARFSPERRVVNDESINPGKRERWEFRCGSSSGKSLSTGSLTQRKHECAVRLSTGLTEFELTEIV
jgi:hypothetical protein